MLAAAVVYAQSPDQPGAKELRDKNFSKAERKILKTYYADTTNAMSCYMMGLLYGDTLNPRHDNERAYEAMLQTRRIVGKLGNIKRALLRRNGLTTDTIDKHLARLTTQGFDAARRQNTKKAYDHFYDFYRATMPDSLRDLAHESASTIDYTAAEQENTIEAYEHFLAMHPESSKAYDAEQRMHTLAYERAKSINTLNAYERFLADYPDADEADEAELQIHTITYYRALSSGTEEAFRRYADTYPESPYAAAAKRKANALRFADETDATDWQSFKRYIEKHPDDTERVAQAKQIIAELSIETKNADGLVWSLHHCDSTMRDTIIRATHDLYVNSDHIAEFDAIYGRIAPEDIRERDRRALDAIMSVNTSDRNSVANALRATAPYRISYDMLLYMIELDASRGKWDYVNKTVEQFADQFEGNADYEALRATLSAQPLKIHVEPLDENINSSHGDEYSPVLSSDERTIFFAGKNRAGNIGGEDIFMSTKTAAGQWRRPFTVPGLNTVGHNETPMSLSHDGQTIFIFQNGKMMVSHMTNEGWSMPKPLPDQLQTGTWQSDAMITADGRAILFAARKKTEHEVVPSINIFVSTLNDKGEWSEPISLGATINTFGNDRAPFLHADMRTLYFSSNRHSNIGGLDIFKSTRLSDESWTEWSEPVNLGKEINTVGDDCWFTVNKSGTKAYMSQKRGQSQDVCVIDLPESMRPGTIATLSGKVTDANGRPCRVQLRWIDLQNGTLCGIYTTNPTDGSFNIALPLGRNYGYYVASDAFFPASGSIDLRTTTIARKERATLVTASVAQMQSDTTSIELPLGSIFFNSSKAQLAPQAAHEIKRLAAMIRRHNFDVELTVYTDEQSASKKNSLDQQRAAAVKSALVKSGCNASKITTTVKTADKGKELTPRQHRQKSIMTLRVQTPSTASTQPGDATDE